MGFKSVVCKARAVNVLHCICVSGYHHHHHHHDHHHYHYHHYYCISTQATLIIKRALIGLACVAWAGNYLITGRARGTREGERRPPLLFSPHASSTFLLSPLLSPPNKTKQQQQQQQNWRLLRRLWLALLWNVYAWVKARKETGGDGPGAGEMKLCPCYTDSSIMSSKMRKSRHLRKFNGIMQNWL